MGRTLEKIVSNDDALAYTVPERIRLSFEELGPAFVKFGQLLATRPDLVPPEYSEEFKKLHDQVHTLPWPDIKGVLNHHFGQDLSQVFKEFDQTPLAAASIAQVHTATLLNGDKVVVKIQRPGIEAIIEEDLSVLYTLAELIEKYIPEARIYSPLQAVDEFARALELETNFIIEANNVRRFKENFASEPSIKVPEVYAHLSGKRVLVLEALDGIPLSHKNALDQEGISPEQVLKTGLRCYLKMVFSDGLFHGDLHAGNFFVLKNNRIGLIDFGVVGRLNRKTQSSIASMLIALATEDYDRLAYEYVDLAPYSDHVDVDLFARDLRDLISPYYGLTLKNVNVGKLLMDSSGIAAQYRLQLPAELIMFFKSIVTIEGMGRVIMSDFNFLAYSLEFASELMQSRAEPT
ncbi:MAG: AarF/ABC1/UbiB kinase family protein, partial [Bdellovibrionota bacterium]